MTRYADEVGGFDRGYVAGEVAGRQFIADATAEDALAMTRVLGSTEDTYFTRGFAVGFRAEVRSYIEDAGLTLPTARFVER
jgi:hypothetical protein